ncbi:unnamed protein product [Danaus chrysippus]|uniref:(African queen) hypothetical protein n=1 Tax=Danaus chrysippus TaxID=151541 RepID=A0A8J2QGP0_9NEOP|nr:unnamed protein product [Danaus chrysippus]
MNTDFERDVCRRACRATSSTERRPRRPAECSRPRARNAVLFLWTERPINGRQPPGRGRRSFTTTALMALEPGALA